MTDQTVEVNHERGLGIDLARKGKTMEATKSNEQEVASTPPDGYETPKQFRDAVFAANERLIAGRATADDVALVEEVIDGHASFIAALEAHAATVATEEAAMALQSVLDVAADELERVRAAAPDGNTGNGPDLLWLWYPRGGAVALGVWANEEDENGDDEWHRDIEGWNLPDSPPWVEIVFRVPLCDPALRGRLERYAKNGDGYFEPQLRGALQRVAGK